MQYAYPLLAIFIWAGNTVITKMSAGAIYPEQLDPHQLRRLVIHPGLLGAGVENETR